MTASPYCPCIAAAYVWENLHKYCGKFRELQTQEI